MRQWTDLVAVSLQATQTLFQTMFPLLIRSGIRKLVVGLWFAMVLSMMGLPLSQHWGPNWAPTSHWNAVPQPREIAHAATTSDVTGCRGAEDTAATVGFDGDDTETATGRRVFKARRSANWWL